MPSNTFEVRYDDEVRTYAVVAAGFLAVQFRGGVGVVIVVNGDPSFSMILPVPELTLEPGSAWHYPPENRADLGISIYPIMADVDFYLVSRVTVTVVGHTADAYHLRLVGVIDSRVPAQADTTITIDAAFEFRGFTQHHETDEAPVASSSANRLFSKNPWRIYIDEEMGLQLGNVNITAYTWRHTDRLRQLCQLLFDPPPPVEAARPPESFGVRWFRWLYPAPISHVTPSSSSCLLLRPPSVRQSKLLLAALLEHILPSESCFEWNIPARELAQMIRRYTDAKATPNDEELVRRYRNTAMHPGGMIFIRPDDVVGDRASELLQFVAELSLTLNPSMMADSFVWRLMPERSRVGCDIVRCIFGDSPQAVQFDRSWRSPDVVGIARAAYDTNDFTRLPVLADALRDAGCTNESVLAHCHNTRTHVRGCWVLDAILRPVDHD